MKIIKSLLILCVCVFPLSGNSLADPERATVLIDNPTNKTIHYQFKWGPEVNGRITPWRLAMKRHIGKNIFPQGFRHRTFDFSAFSTFDGGAERKYKLDIGWDNNPRRYHFQVNNNTVSFYKD